MCHASYHIGLISLSRRVADNVLDKRCIITVRRTYQVLQESNVQDGGCMGLNVRAFRFAQTPTPDTRENAVDAKKASARKGGLIGGPSRY